MSDLTTSDLTLNATSSQVSASGADPFGKPDGKMTDESGQALVPANLSAAQARKLGLLTSGTFGLHSSTSSRSADLRLSLVSKLKQRSATDGSTLYRLTWKESATPLQRPVSLLRASGLRTYGNDFTSWVTPTTRDWKDGPGDIKPRAGSTKPRLDQLPRQANLATHVRLTASGVTQTGSSAEMASGGLLNPEHSRWLIGLPAEWGLSAPTEMP